MLLPSSRLPLSTARARFSGCPRAQAGVGCCRRDACGQLSGARWARAVLCVEPGRPRRAAVRGQRCHGVLLALSGPAMLGPARCPSGHSLALSALTFSDRQSRARKNASPGSLPPLPLRLSLRLSCQHPTPPLPLSLSLKPTRPRDKALPATAVTAAPARRCHCAGRSGSIGRRWRRQRAWQWPSTASGATSSQTRCSSETALPPCSCWTWKVVHKHPPTWTDGAAQWPPSPHPANPLEVLAILPQLPTALRASSRCVCGRAPWAPPCCRLPAMAP
jgi:hypothetical protein